MKSVLGSYTHDPRNRTPARLKGCVGAEDVARIGFLSGVGVHVRRDVTLLRRRVVAHVARTGFIPGVGAHVNRPSVSTEP